MSEWLAPFESEIRALAKCNEDLIEQAILQWRVFHHVIRRYQLEHPDWQFIRHEDLSLDPVGGFERLHEALGLSFTGRCRAEVIASSARENLTDASAAGKSTHFVHLNTAANLRNWQRRLSRAEIARTRDGTADVACDFYQDSDWN
jgi:hypothetical protein